MISAISVLAASFIAASASEASAHAASWSRPATIAYEAAGWTADPGFIESPDGEWIDLVTLRERVGLELYPWEGRGAFGKPVRVPSSRGAQSYPKAAINDAGALAMGWTEVYAPPHAEADLGAGEYFYAVRAVVRRADGYFGPVETLAQPSGPFNELSGIEINSGGQASALWEEGQHGVLFAEASQTGRFLASERVGPFGSTALLQSLNGHPQVIFSPPGSFAEPPPTPLYAEEPPFADNTVIGKFVYGTGEISDSGTKLVTDGHGDELIVSTDWQYGKVETDYRPAGGSFGPVRTIARTGPSGSGVLCDLNATMNEYGEALAAWACDPSSGGVDRLDFFQAALFRPGGAVDNLSARQPATDGGASPALALDYQGRSLVAFEGPEHDGLFSLAGSNKRFDRHRLMISRGSFNGTTQAGVAITRAGTALVTWSDESADGTERIRVAQMYLSPARRNWTPSQSP